jgi:hypothetical protein
MLIGGMTGIGLAGHSSTVNAYAGVWFFAAFWVILVLGFGIHWQVDRHRPGRGPHRMTELMLVWVVVLGGVWTILGGLGLTDGHSYQDAGSTGYVPSMYEWEVGWADIAIGFLGVACARKALRGQWMTAAVTVLAISFGGDAIGHIMQWAIHNNTAPVNVWAIPQDILQAGLAVLLLLIYRRSPDTPDPTEATVAASVS